MVFYALLVHGHCFLIRVYRSQHFSPILLENYPLYFSEFCVFFFFCVELDVILIIFIALCNHDLYRWQVLCDFVLTL